MYTVLFFGILDFAATYTTAGKSIPVPAEISEKAKNMLNMPRPRRNVDILNPEQRKLFRGIFRKYALAIEKTAPEMKITEVEMNGVKAYWVTSPKARGDDAVIMYLHGGAYVTGNAKDQAGSVLPVLEDLGIKGLSVEYRLAPEHPFPAAVNDAMAVYLALLSQGYKPEQIAMVGESAGGGLSLATVLALRDVGKPLPGAVAVMSPWTDLTMSGDSQITQVEWDPILKLNRAVFWAKAYAGKTSRTHPLVSPLFNTYENFPPTLILVGTRELIASDAMRVSRKMREAGVDVTLDVWDGMWHVHPIHWVFGIPESIAAQKFIAKFLREMLLK